MSTHKRKQHGGLDWGKLLSKGLEIGKKVKDSGLISKGLSAASTIASALGKDSLAGKLGSAQGFAEAAGAGRKRRKSAKPKQVKFVMKSPTQRAEVIQMDGANQLSGTTGTGRKQRRPKKQHGKGFFDDLRNGITGIGRKHTRPKKQHGEGFFDDLWGGIKSVAGQVLPIALQMAPKLLGAGRRGAGLNLAGRGLNMAGSGYEHDSVVPNSIPNIQASSRARPPRQIGHGSLSRCRRGCSTMVLN